MKIIATGWREYKDPVLPGRALDTLAMVAWGAGEQLIVVHGDGRGLDQLVKQWVKRRRLQHGDKVQQIPYPAKWAEFGRRAGVFRNMQMWDENWHNTDLCLGFPGIPGISTGTPHCMSLARDVGCPVWEFPWGAGWVTPPKARLLTEALQWREQDGD